MKLLSRLNGNLEEAYRILSEKRTKK